MNKYNKSLVLLSNRKVTEDYFVLRLQAEDQLVDINPGQFVQLRVDGSNTTFLRRPISIYDIDTKKNTIDLLIKIAGDGTSKLSSLVAGDMLSIIYPLGNSFTIPGKDEKVLLVGGGVGVAPLYFAAKTLKECGIEVEFLLGYRSYNQVIDLERFSKIGKVYLTTEDGSTGHKGLVIDHPQLLSGDFDRIYCCGPDPMMKAVAAIAMKDNIHCEVSLENLMACGIGVCLCCIEETVRGNLCTCTEGPVFNINELKWQI